jgi:hypothetical protein
VRSLPAAAVQKCQKGGCEVARVRKSQEESGRVGRSQEESGGVDESSLLNWRGFGAKS